jgi:flagellar hook-length control protein FliK
MNMTQAGAAPAPNPQWATAPAVGDSGGGTTAPAGDFLLALAQMVGANLAAAPGATPVAAELQSEAGDEPGDDAASLLAAMPLPLPLAVDAAPERATQSASDGDDPLVMLGLSRRAENVVRDTTHVLASSLAAGDEKPAFEPLPVVAPTEPSSSRAQVHETAPQQRGLQSPVGTQAWADELGTRIVLLTERGQHSASLRLSPEHLGPLEIRIATRDDQVSVWFGAAHADTRAAIEHALPRLREMFEAQGMSLADASVFHEAPKQRPPTWPVPRVSGVEAGAPEIENRLVPMRVGLVDMYV